MTHRKPFYLFFTRPTFLIAALLIAAYFLFSLLQPHHTLKVSDWMDRAITRDFKRYQKHGISEELLESTWQACKKHQEFLRYQIIDAKVYGPESRIKVLLTELVQHYSVPDVDFIYYYEDRLKKDFFKRTKHRDSAPIFVSAKHKQIKHVILFADWNYDIQNKSGGWNFLINTINEEYPKIAWSDKTEKLFWRGTPWDGKHFGMYDFDNWKTIPRGTLVAKSRQNPEWIDASFSEYPTKCVQKNLSQCIEQMGPIEYASWEKVLSYKYQMIIDGVTCSFPATQWKLLSGNLCFKQDSDDIQYYYDELIPWKHYIPVQHNLSDIEDKILWAKKHDKQAQEIAKNGREFALTHLMPEHILLYCYKTLCRYAELQRFKPKISSTPNS
jgi:hypothetical protein